jgi:hypothetical protein
MGTITDGFGIWNDLGAVTPNINSWIKFPNLSVGGLDTIRAKFIYNADANISSYGLIRSVYTVNGDSVITKAIKIYVQPESIILDIPILPDFKKREIYLRNFERKKYGYDNKFVVPDFP